MERVEKLENSTEESLGIEETVCMKSVVRNWRVNCTPCQGHFELV